MSLAMATRSAALQTAASRGPAARRQAARGTDSAAAAPALRRAPGSCACGGGCPRCGGSAAQSGLTLGATDDGSEREAERVATQVMAAWSSAESPAGERLPNHRIKPTAVSRRVRGGSLGGSAGGSVPAEVKHTLARPGQGIDSPLRRRMESRLGQDFSAVRLHTDAAGAASAAAIGAQAYTAGQHIVFGAGQFAPHSLAGQHLLAHELVHVAQQRGGASGWVQRSVVPGAPPSGSREGGGGPISGEAPGAGSAGGGAGGRAGAGGGAHGGASGTGLPEICDPPAGMACTPGIDSPINPQMQFFFGVGSDVLSAGDVGQLQMAAAMLQILPLNTSVRLDGYASTEGGCEANWALSCRRAQAVANVLTHPGGGLGLDPGAIERNAHGESDEAGESLAANRRALLSVDIVLPPTPTPPPAVAPPTPGGCSPSGPQGTATGCTPNPGGPNLPDVGGTHTESHPFAPCSMTQADVAASPNWCVDAQQAHGGETCYREIPTTAGAPGRQFCYSANCCHDSADVVSVVSPTSPGSNSCCTTDHGSLPGHIWEDVVPEFIDDPQRVIRDIFGL